METGVVWSKGEWVFIKRFNCTLEMESNDLCWRKLKYKIVLPPTEDPSAPIPFLLVVIINLMSHIRLSTIIWTLKWLWSPHFTCFPSNPPPEQRLKLENGLGQLNSNFKDLLESRSNNKFKYNLAMLYTINSLLRLLLFHRGRQL